jgi:hypothetical protein
MFVFCEKAVETEKERNNTEKLTIALISEGRLCFYRVLSVAYC